MNKTPVSICLRFILHPSSFILAERFRGLESNQHWRLQRPLSYLLDDPGMKVRFPSLTNAVADEGLEPSRRLTTALETAASAVPPLGHCPFHPSSFILSSSSPCGFRSRLPSLKDW